MERLNEVYLNVFLYLILVMIFIDMLRNGYLKKIWKTFTDYIKPGIIIYILITIIATAVLIIWVDIPVIKYVQSMKNPVVDKVFYYINILSNGIFLFPFLVTLYTAAVIYKNKRLKIFIESSILGLLISGLVIQIMKILILRARPSTNLGAFSFLNYTEMYLKGKFFHPIFTSMPSGHAGNISVLAICGWMAMRDRMKYLLLLLPLFVAVSRMIHNKHWLSDVFAGTIIGAYIGFVVFKSIKNRKTVEYY